MKKEWRKNEKLEKRIQFKLHAQEEFLTNWQTLVSISFHTLPSLAPYFWNGSISFQLMGKSDWEFDNRIFLLKNFNSSFVQSFTIFLISIQIWTDSFPVRYFVCHPNLCLESNPTWIWHYFSKILTAFLWMSWE